MRDFPSCSGENNVQIADSPTSNAGKTPQNLVISIYRCRIRGKTCLITVTWTKTLISQCVTLGLDDDGSCPCKVEIKPWLFTKRKGSKNLEAYSCNINVFWDLTSAKFGSSPEHLGGFYVCVVVDKEMILCLGDMSKEAYRKTNAIIDASSLGAVIIAKKEHVFGKRTFETKARFWNDGEIYDLVVECDTSLVEPCLVVRVDGKTLLEVKRVHWKFRGNDTIVVDRVSVEVLWDVHSWFFGLTSSPGHGVFMFRTCQPVDKTWSLTSSKSQSVGFSLVLYAWKNE